MKPFRKTYRIPYLLWILLLLRGVSLYAQEGKNFEVTGNWHTEMTITGFTGNTISLSYQSLPANQAGMNHNSLWLWPSSQVPWRYPPMAKKVLPLNYGESGSYVLEDVSIAIYTPYTACFAVDSTVQRICACAHLSATSDSVTTECFMITLSGVTSNSLTFDYTTLPGYLPAAYGNWFGIWKGRASPYNAPAPMASSHPPDDSSSGTASLNNISLESNQVYTLIYFAGPELTQAAAMLTFIVK